MPTSTGKPKVGERIELTIDSHSPQYGTVLHRYDGQLWGLKVRWDDGHTTILTSAEYYLRRGQLKVVPRA